MEQLKERKDMDPKDFWKLNKMYDSDAAWEQDFLRLKESGKKISDFQGTLKDAKGIKAYLDFRVKTEAELDRLYCYASLRNSEDTAAADAKSMKMRAYALYVDFMTANSYADPEILSLSGEELQTLIQDEKVAPYRTLLERLADLKPHTLTAAEEKIMASFGEVLGAPSGIYHNLNDADIRFETVKDGQGQEHELTNASFIPLQMSMDRTLRKQSFETYYKGYKEHINTIAGLMSANVKRAGTEAQLRHYKDAREMMASSERVPVKVYDTLIATVRKHLPDMYRYLRLRKRILGVDELHFYDIYAPLLQEKPVSYSFEQAKEMMFHAIKPLGEEYTAVVRQGVTDGWMDVYPNKGKTGGAYSSGCYLSDPYILLNYTGTLDSVSTLVHEMGHSVHSYFSRNHQPSWYADYTIFVAEVASTVNENLLIESLLEKENDPKKRLALLNQYLENFKGTVFRQTMFAEFEKKMHEASEKGEALTPKFLCGLYRSLNEDYFGTDMVIDEEISYEWARIPHFYTPFYVYKYATSYSAAVALSEGIRAEFRGEKKGCVSKYLDFLKMGCSKDPLEELQAAGVDLSAAEPVDGALEKFRKVLEEAEGLAG